MAQTLSRSDAKNKINRGAFHRKVVLEVVTQYGDLLCYAQPKHQRDKEVVLAAVVSSSWAVKYVAEDLLQDDNFALDMIRANPMALRMLPERCRHDPDMVLAAVSGDGRCLSLSSLQQDEDFVREAVCCSAEALQFAPEPLKADFDLVVSAVSADGRALRFAAPELRSDRQVALAAVEGCAGAMAHVGEELRGNRHFVLEALRLQGAALEYLPDFQDDEEVVLEALASNSGALRFSTLKSQRSFALLAVETAGMSLEHVSAELLEDKQVVLAAVTSNGLALQFASQTLKGDEEVVWCAVNQDPAALSFSTFQTNKAFLIRCAKGGCYSTLDFADRGLTSDKNFALSLLSVDVATLQHLSEGLRNDCEILLHATALSEQDFGGDKDFCDQARRLRSALAMVRRHPNSRNIVLRAVGWHPLSLWYASSELQEDPDFQEQAAWLIASKDGQGLDVVSVAQ